jgi:hypothetical protein
MTNLFQTALKVEIKSDMPAVIRLGESGAMCFIFLYYPKSEHIFFFPFWHRIAVVDVGHGGETSISLLLSPRLVISPRSESHARVSLE